MNFGLREVKSRKKPRAPRWQKKADLDRNAKPNAQLEAQPEAEPEAKVQPEAEPEAKATPELEAELRDTRRVELEACSDASPEDRMLKNWSELPSVRWLEQSMDSAEEDVQAHEISANPQKCPVEVRAFEEIGECEGDSLMYEEVGSLEDSEDHYNALESEDASNEPRDDSAELELRMTALKSEIAALFEAELRTPCSSRTAVHIAEADAAGGSPKDDCQPRARKGHLLTRLQPFMRTIDDLAKVKKCVRGLKKAVFRCLSDLPGDWFISVFGSAISGFGTRGCDLDVVVHQGEASGQHVPQLVIHKLQLELQKSDDFVVKSTVLSARVPIINLQYGDQEIDLSVNNTLPLLNTRLLHAYASMHPTVAKLGIAVKLWAKENGVCGARQGHLSAYAFVLMVIYYLQVACHPRMMSLQAGGLHDDRFRDEDDAVKFVSSVCDSGGRWTSTESIESLYAGFFAFYIREFWWGSEVVSVRMGERLHVASDLADWQFRSRDCNRLHIEDPFERNRNLRDVLSPENEHALRAAMHVELDLVTAVVEGMRHCDTTDLSSDAARDATWASWLPGHAPGQFSERSQLRPRAGMFPERSHMRPQAVPYYPPGQQYVAPHMLNLARTPHDVVVAMRPKIYPEHLVTDDGLPGMNSLKFVMPGASGSYRFRRGKFQPGMQESAESRERMQLSGLQMPQKIQRGRGGSSKCPVASVPTTSRVKPTTSVLFGSKKCGAVATTSTVKPSADACNQEGLEL